MIIESIFIYNEEVTELNKSMSDEQIQAEKVIYYYPNETEEATKISHSSTMEGMSAFFSQFSKSHLDHIVTNSNLIAINKWYKHLFIAIVIKNVYNNNKMELLMCKLMHSILNNFISIFTLLHGHIRNFLKYKKCKATEDKNKKKEVLQVLLDDYVFTYINTINNENINIHNELQSFHFFPIDRHTYISVQNLISSLIHINKQIKFGGLFYEGYLVYSNLPKEDIKIIYNYLVSYNGVVNNLKLNQYPFKKIASSAAINAIGGLSSFARCNSLDDKNAFLLGIKKSSVFIPIITLSDEKKYKLIAFIYKGILLMLLIKGNTIKDEDFDILLDLQSKCTNDNLKNIYNLSKINDRLCKQYKNFINQEDSIRFFYYNHCSNSIKYSFNNKKISNEELFLVADFHFLFNESEIKYNNTNLNKTEHWKNKVKSNLSNELFNWGNNIYRDLKNEENSKEKKDNDFVTAKMENEVKDSETESAQKDEKGKAEEKIEKNKNIVSQKEEKQKKENISKNEAKRFKLVCNEEFKKKLFEDNSDDVKIEKILYKEGNSTWIYGQKSLERELFIFPDEFKTSLSKAQQEINKIICNNFSNIYI